jgi:hypothetical protein
MTRLLAILVVLVVVAIGCAGSADDDVQTRDDRAKLETPDERAKLERLLLEHASGATCNGHCEVHHPRSVQCTGPGKKQSTYVFYECDVDYEHLGDEGTAPSCVALDPVSPTGYWSPPEQDC